MSTYDTLIQNFNEFKTEAQNSEKNSNFNSSATLYFKAIAVLVDAFILKNDGFIPKNHKERFMLLKHKYLELYKILDRDFPLYQQTYRISVDNEVVKLLKDDIKRIEGITLKET